MKIQYFLGLMFFSVTTVFGQEKTSNEELISQMKIDAKENLLDIDN